MLPKTTTSSLAVLELGRPRRSQQMFVLASCQADGTCKRSYATSWTGRKYRHLKGWLCQQPQHARTKEELDALLRAANHALGHGNKTRDGRARCNDARAFGTGRWHGALSRAKLLGQEGCVIARGLVSSEDCAALLDVCKRGFNAAALHRRDKRIAKRAISRLAGRRVRALTLTLSPSPNPSPSPGPSPDPDPNPRPRPNLHPNLTLTKVHADLARSRPTLCSLARPELPDADEAWSRVVRRVSDFAGHDVVAVVDAERKQAHRPPCAHALPRTPRCPQGHVRVALRIFMGALLETIISCVRVCGMPPRSVERSWARAGRGSL